MRTPETFVVLAIASALLSAPAPAVAGPNEFAESLAELSNADREAMERARNEVLAKQFLKARRVPKPSQRGKAVGGAALIGAEEQSEFYEAEDLDVGTTIDVFGRPVLLYDADDLTREYYAGRLGVDLAPPQQIHTGTTISGLRGPRELEKVSTLQAQRPRQRSVARSVLSRGLRPLARPSRTTRPIPPPSGLR